jgi:hypothetical protein
VAGQRPAKERGRRSAPPRRRRMRAATMGADAQKGLFVNSTNLCAGKHRANVNAKGQNGKLDKSKPLLRALGCKKAHRKRHRGHRKKKGGGKGQKKR